MVWVVPGDDVDPLYRLQDALSALLITHQPYYYN